MATKRSIGLSEELTARIEKLSRWLLYGVVIGLLPFAFPFIKSAVVGPHVTLVMLFGRGDLFLVTATLVAASFGDLIASGKAQAIVKIWISFFCILVFALCIAWYGTVSTALDVQEKYDASLTAVVSLVFFGLAVIICACSLLLSEEMKAEHRKFEKGKILSWASPPQSSPSASVQSAQ